MVRTQVQLTDEQARRLRRLAAEQEISLAELVRRGVDLVAGSAGGADPAERRRRALAAAGKFRSGRRDLARRHDDRLAEAYQ